MTQKKKTRNENGSVTDTETCLGLKDVIVLGWALSILYDHDTSSLSPLVFRFS